MENERVGSGSQGMGWEQREERSKNIDILGKNERVESGSQGMGWEPRGEGE